MVGVIPPNSSYSKHDYTAIDYDVSSSEPFIGRHSADMCFKGSCNKRLDKARDIPAPTQRKKVKASDWEQTCPVEGGPVDPELIPSYGGHVAGPIWRSWFIEVLITLHGTYRFAWGAATLTFLYRNLGQASHVNAKELAGCWSLLEAWIYMYFSMFAPMAYMPDRIVRQFGFRQYIPAQRIRPMEVRRPANNRMYVVRNLFMEALWLEAPSHLLTETWTNVPAIPPSACTDDYMQ
ncbi:hypothetical protein M9H77_27233 [Catharanthus roseus]|uniref:Uncharacterized protein n=1 Tax=Catharanthus roseus TaxID=4058 RepID=A0ACC0ADJ5_CATRO|nr:hypothetical protein M9H77_27233 [Catharanthus roseus]